MAITDWMPTLKAKLAEITELVQVHTMDELPADLLVFPSAVITVTAGRFEYSSGGPCLDFHDVQVTVYLANQVLPEAFGTALPIIEKVRNKLAGGFRLSALVDQIMPDEAQSYQGPGGVSYGDKELLGIIFRYRVKENVTGDFAVAA